MTLSDIASRSLNSNSWVDIICVCRRAGIPTWNNKFGAAKAVRQISAGLRNTRTRPVGVLVRWDSYAGTYEFRREA